MGNIGMLKRMAYYKKRDFWEIGFLGVLLIIAFIAIPGHQNCLIFISAILVGLATAYSAWFISLSLGATVEMEIKRRTFEYLHMFERDFQDVRAFISEKIDSNKILPEKLYEHISNDATLGTKVKIYLNFFEDLSIAIQEGYIDERIVHTSFCYVMPKAIKDFTPYIDKRKKVFKKICAETQKLKSSWEKGKYLYSEEFIPNID